MEGIPQIYLPAQRSLYDTHCIVPFFSIVPHTRGCNTRYTTWLGLLRWESTPVPLKARWSAEHIRQKVLFVIHLHPPFWFDAFLHSQSHHFLTLAGIDLLPPVIFNRHSSLKSPCGSYQTWIQVQRIVDSIPFVSQWPAGQVTSMDSTMACSGCASMVNSRQKQTKFPRPTTS